LSVQYVKYPKTLRSNTAQSRGRRLVPLDTVHTALLRETLILRPGWPQDFTNWDFGTERHLDAAVSLALSPLEFGEVERTSSRTLIHVVRKRGSPGFAEGSLNSAHGNVYRGGSLAERIHGVKRVHRGLAGCNAHACTAHGSHFGRNNKIGRAGDVPAQRQGHSCGDSLRAGCEAHQFSIVCEQRV
jgi:hypothetical protein